MKILQFPDDAYIVTKANHKLYDSTSAATLTLTGTKPSVTFKCAVTISAVAGHTDVIGSVTIGSETLTFTQAAKKTTQVNLTALPVCTTANLDCRILIEAIDTGNAPIIDETATATKIQFENTSSGFFNPQGVWTVYSGSYAMCKDVATIGDVIRYGSLNMPIKKVDVEKWFSKILYYIFYL